MAGAGADGAAEGGGGDADVDFFLVEDTGDERGNKEIDE